jgi:hypothetical protein
MKVPLFSSALLQRLVFLVPAAFVISCSGGPKLYPVHGKLLQNNQPVAGVLLTFHPKDATVYSTLPTGLTDDDGTFIVETGANEGAPAGEYVVTMIAPQVVKETGKQKITMGKHAETADRFKGAYASEASSKLRVEIKKGDNNLEPFSLN